MNGILHWNDAVAYFGNELKAHRLALGEASMATHCLLACRSVHSGTAKMVSGDGEHAERRLLQSAVWKTEIHTALSTWHPHDAPMLVLVVLNRSPCADCAHSLADALHKFNDRYALTTEKQHFVLASLGYYHSSKDIVRSAAGLPQSFTTDRGMRALLDAGWKLCTIDFGQGLTLRGREFHAYLQQLQ